MSIIIGGLSNPRGIRAWTIPVGGRMFAGTSETAVLPTFFLGAANVFTSLDSQSVLPTAVSSSVINEFTSTISNSVLPTAVLSSVINEFTSTISDSVLLTAVSSSVINEFTSTISDSVLPTAIS